MEKNECSPEVEKAACQHLVRRFPNLAGTPIQAGKILYDISSCFPQLRLRQWESLILLYSIPSESPREVQEH
jgi:hypothetical protein